MSDYCSKRGDIYYYHRRVPNHIRPFEKKSFVRISLGTSDEKEAKRKAALYNDYIEDFWRSLIKANGREDAYAQYRAIVQLAKAHGFAYKSVAEIARAPLPDVIARVNAATRAIESPASVSAFLGGSDQPKLLLSQCLEKFWPLSADRLTNKSAHQIRKWKNPRVLAMNSLIEAIGDKDIAEITRKDILTFRQWWMVRIERGDVIADTVNRCLIQARDILTVVGMHHEIDIDFDVLFSKLRLKGENNSRPPYEANYVQDTLLNPANLSGLNKEARLLIFAMADTGAREAELIGLTKDDIVLDSDVPHIWIRPAKGYTLKTSTSERKIPLVGASLYAFRQLPDGFVHYRNADTVSATVNKYLRENDLKPTLKHSLYSLRHTFKDRLRDAGAPEEVIDELMGHKKSGPKYGRGHMLERKHEWMQKIAFHVHG